MGVRVQVVIESDSRDDETTISAWFQTTDCQEFIEWIEKVRSLESYNQSKGRTQVKGFTGR